VRANACASESLAVHSVLMPTQLDPIATLKSQAGALLADLVRTGNVDDLGVRLGTDRFRIADLRRGRLERFSLEALLRFLVRAGMRIELRAVRAPLATAARRSA
jgi:predicted XRE-type DNA-binding protein